ncbi:hypothetical protein NIES25_05770 [Nostoc linckia NIES-25]|nr:hypothetical protein NIES25_05770 [Nostoc linckia NIES-25]
MPNAQNLTSKKSDRSKNRKMPTYSYQHFGLDFDIELNTKTDTVESQGLWGFEVYHSKTHTSIWGESDKYENSGYAYSAAIDWIARNQAWIERMLSLTND